MVRCCVPGCTVVANNGFHAFPANSELRLKWIKQTKTGHICGENLSINSWNKVCKNHFRPEDYITYTNGNVRLRYNTIPTLRLPEAVTLKTGHNDTPSSNIPLRKQKPLNSTNIKSATSEEMKPNHVVGDSSASIICLESNTNEMNFDIRNEILAQTPKSSESKLEEENRKLKAMVAEMQTQMKAIVSEANKKLRIHEKQATRLRKKVRSLKLDNDKVIAYLSKQFKAEEFEFIKIQLNNGGKKPNGKRYTLEQKSFCLALYKLSPRTYRFMRRFMTLPSKRTLGRHSAQLMFECGINDKLFDYLKTTVNNMDDIDRYCVLVWDEMSLKSHLDYSKGRDVIDGFVELSGSIRKPAFATHALTFMIRGIHRPFKQPVGFYYTDGLKSFELAEIVILVTKALLDTGLKIIGSVSDQASINVSTIDRLTKSHPKTLNGELLTYKIQDAIIIHCFDPPHLIKGVRNNLMTKNLKHFVFKRWSPSNSNFKKDVNKEEALIATWDEVAYLYKFNLRGSTKLLTKIGDEHINPTKLKMKVSVATQVFSETYGKVMLHCSEKKVLPRDFSATAQILFFFNDLFDSMNGSGSPVKNELKASVTKNSVHFKYWEYALRMLSKMKLLSKETGLATNRSRVLQNWESTIRGYIELTKKCFSLGMTEVSIRNLNQDGLENFFGGIKLYCQVAKTPIAIHFRTAYITSILNNLTSHSMKSNCEPDSSTALLNNVHNFLMITKKKINHENCHDENDHDENENIVDDYLDPIIFDPLFSEEKLNFVESEAINYASSEISEEMCKAIHCKHCRNNLQTSSKRKDHDIIAMRTDLVKYPSEAFIDNVKISLTFINDSLPNICASTSVSKKLCSDMEQINISKMGCKKHHEEVGIKFKKCVAQYGLFTFCKNVNNLLSGKITLNSRDDCNNPVEQLAYDFRLKRKRVGKYTDKFEP